MGRKRKATKPQNKSVDETDEQPINAGSNAVVADGISFEEMVMVSVKEEVEEDVEGPRDTGDFTVLGDFKAKKKQKVEQVLPYWLQFPQIIDETVSYDWARIPRLEPNLIQKLKDNGLEKSLPVQSSVMPHLLAQCQMGLYPCFRQRDICICAPPASGKTLTFVLPIIQTLQYRVMPHVRALVILPDRDKAIEVFKVFQQYARGTDVKVGLAAGKKAFHLEQEKLVGESYTVTPTERWCSMVDIVVATRGRLLDHIDRTEGFDLTHVRWLVIGEADRQMEDVRNDWLAHVEGATTVPKEGAYGPYRRDPRTVFSALKEFMQPQKLLISATLTQNFEMLDQVNLYMPMLYTVVAPGSKSSSVAKSEQDAEADVTGARQDMV